MSALAAVPDLAENPAMSAISQASDLRESAVIDPGSRILAVDSSLIELLPDRGLRRGSTIAIGDTPGAMSLTLTLLAAPMDTGAWAAVMGLPEFGVIAATDFGIPLHHLALVPDPGDTWLEATAALLDSIDIVVLAPPRRCKASDARRLSARARQRGSVLIICPPAHTPHRANTPCWPESADIELTVRDNEWQGMQCGHGRLRNRELDIVASGRRLAGPARHAHLQWGQQQWNLGA